MRMYILRALLLVSFFSIYIRFHVAHGVATWFSLETQHVATVTRKENIYIFIHYVYTTTNIC